MVTDRDHLGFIGGPATDRVILVGIIGEGGVILAAQAHGCASLPASVTENSASRSSGLKPSGESLP